MEMVVDAIPLEMGSYKMKKTLDISAALCLGNSN